MSTGIGFAGLGKHLADRTLGLLKGPKLRDVRDKKEDLRETPENHTDYNDLVRWQSEMRTKTLHIRRLIILSFIVLLATTIGVVLFFV